MTQPPTFAGYAEVRQTAGYAANPLFELASWERPVIATIDFAGIHEFDKDSLTKALKSVQLSAGAYYDKALIDKAEQELKRQYLTRGYYAADVTTTISPIDR
ncbi:MAG: outer membrane protein insertion porin family, partial [Paraburkholderia sp.]|nr:outer membrane protein insertion porin family [Paraburkholderia sp.]